MTKARPLPFELAVLYVVGHMVRQLQGRMARRGLIVTAEAAAELLLWELNG